MRLRRHPSPHALTAWLATGASARVAASLAAVRHPLDLTVIAPPAEASNAGGTVAPHLVADILERARTAGVVIGEVGFTGGDALTLQDEGSILVARLRECFEGWLPAYMAAAA